MADAVKVVTVNTQQDDFVVQASVALEKLMDPAEVQEGDLWTFMDGGGNGTMVISRRRVTTVIHEPPPEEPPAEEPPSEEEPPPEEEPEPARPLNPYDARVLLRTAGADDARRKRAQEIIDRAQDKRGKP